jgi:hypothetical protein
VDWFKCFYAYSFFRSLKLVGLVACYFAASVDVILNVVAVHIHPCLMLEVELSGFHHGLKVAWNRDLAKILYFFIHTSFHFCWGINHFMFCVT